MLEMENEMDAESFYRAILITRGVAVSRPHNLVKYAELHSPLEDISSDSSFGE